MNESAKSKAELIDEKLMGLAVMDGDEDYGIVCRIERVNSDYFCYTTTGHKFYAGLLLNLVAAISRMEKAVEKANSIDDPNHSIYEPQINRQNTLVTRRHKAHSKQMRMHSQVDTFAKFDDGSIDITTYVSSGEAFEEDSQKSDDEKGK